MAVLRRTVRRGAVENVTDDALGFLPNKSWKRLDNRCAVRQWIFLQEKNWVLTTEGAKTIYKGYTLQKANVVVALTLYDFIDDDSTIYSELKTAAAERRSMTDKEFVEEPDAASAARGVYTLR